MNIPNGMRTSPDTTNHSPSDNAQAAKGGAAPREERDQSGTAGRDGQRRWLALHGRHSTRSRSLRATPSAISVPWYGFGTQSSDLIKPISGLSNRSTLVAS